MLREKDFAEFVEYLDGVTSFEDEGRFRRGGTARGRIWEDSRGLLDWRGGGRGLCMVSPDPNTPEAKERLKYAMLGFDESSTNEKLEKFTGVVGWSYLKAHYMSGVLYFVDPELALAEVGYAITEDHRERVEGWLKSGDLVKIGDLHAEQWKDGEAEFEALVVSPFVLCRPVSG